MIDAGSSRRLGDGSDIESEERSRAVDKGRERSNESIEDYTQCQSSSLETASSGHRVGWGSNFHDGRFRQLGTVVKLKMDARRSLLRGPRSPEPRVSMEEASIKPVILRSRVAPQLVVMIAVSWKSRKRAVSSAETSNEALGVPGSNANMQFANTGSPLYSLAGPPLRTPQGLLVDLPTSGYVGVSTTPGALSEKEYTRAIDVNSTPCGRVRVHHGQDLAVPSGSEDGCWDQIRMGKVG